MTQVHTLADFILHIGPNGAMDSCALIRHPGDDWIGNGQVFTRPVEADRFDVEIVTADLRLRLPGVTQKHVTHIRDQGLYVIQRKPTASAPESVLLEWHPC